MFMSRSKISTFLMTMATRTSRLVKTGINWIAHPVRSARAHAFAAAMASIIKSNCPESKFKIWWVLKSTAVEYSIVGADIPAQTCFAWIKNSLVPNPDDEPQW